MLSCLYFRCIFTDSGCSRTGSCGACARRLCGVATLVENSVEFCHRVVFETSLFGEGEVLSQSESSRVSSVWVSFRTFDRSFPKERRDCGNETLDMLEVLVKRRNTQRERQASIKYPKKCGFLKPLGPLLVCVVATLLIILMPSLRDKYGVECISLVPRGLPKCFYYSKKK